jgi:DNA polymerase-3 subunit epsilon
VNRWPPTVPASGVIIDLETTDQQKDEIIELGMVKFDYLPDGSIAGLTDVFTSFNQPSGSIPEEVTALTGITDEMVRDNASTRRLSRVS